MCCWRVGVGSSYWTALCFCLVSFFLDVKFLDLADFDLISFQYSWLFQITASFSYIIQNLHPPFTSAILT